MPKITKRLLDTLRTDDPRGVMVCDSKDTGFYATIFPSGTVLFGVRYTTKDGGRRKKTLGKYGVLTLDLARRNAVEILRAAASGEDPVKEAQEKETGLTFAKWRKEYIGRAKERKKSWKRDVQYLALALKLFGSKRLAEITTKDCDVFFNRTRKDRGDTSANRALASLKTCLQDAWRLGHLESNPAQRVKMLREHPPRTRVFDDREWARLLGAIAKLEDPFQRVGLVLLFSTGCRLSEALNLKWEDVELETGTMRLPSPKSGKPQAIPLPAPVVPYLKRLRKVGPYVVAGRNPDKPRVDLKRAWAKTVKGARKEEEKEWLKAHPDGPEPPEGFLAGANLHDVRRTVGTRLARRFGVEVAQHILRHSTPSITWRHYVVGQDQEMRRALTTMAEEGGIAKVIPFAKGKER